MTYEEWAATIGRGVTITPEMAFEAGAASRDTEIAEFVSALEHARPFLHGNTHNGYAAVLVDKALAKVRKQT